MTKSVVCLRLNGQDQTLDAPTLALTVTDIVRHCQHRAMPKTSDQALGRGIAVALNGQLIKRVDWEQSVVADGDQVEVLRAVTGG